MFFIGKIFHGVMGNAYYIVPEVLKKNSNPKSNINVIMYILLRGMHPFWENFEIGIFNELGEKVKKTNYSNCVTPTHACVQLKDV